MAFSTKALFLFVALLASGTSAALGRLLHEDQDITITVGQGAQPADMATPYTDQILYNLTIIPCHAMNYFLTWMTAQRCFRVVGQAGYEAIAHYSDHSKGHLTGGKHRVPKDMRTLANKKISVYHSIATALKTLYQNDEMTAAIDQILLDISLDPSDNSTDPKTPAGLGNLAGLAVAAYSMDDGTNQNGSLGGHKYHKQPYLDYTGYAPVNSPYHLTNKSRWQPQLVQYSPSDPARVQHYGPAHACHMKTLGLDSATSFQCKPPGAWNVFGTKEYREAIDTVIDYNVRVAYNDTAKVEAEVADSVPTGTINFIRAVAEKQKWTFDEEVKYNFAFFAAEWDTTVTTLCCKRTWDTIRPISVIRQSGLFNTVRAYAGQKDGLVDMPAFDWKQYNHGLPSEPEYPSGGVALLCTVAQVGQMISGDKNLGAKFVFPKGASFRETDMPQQDVTIDFPTWDSVRYIAKEGRLYGGVDFPVSVVEAERLGTEVGSQTFNWAKSLFDVKTKSS